MGNAKLLRSLLLLLLASFCQAGELKLMSMVGNERYMQDNDLTSINETSCRDIEFHDYDDYADYCDPKYDGDDCDGNGDGDEDDPVCHFSKLNVTLDEEGRYPGVENCCPFLGFIEVATCDGTDENGNPAAFSHTEVCLHHSGSKIPKYRPVKECNSSCHLVNGYLTDPGVSINGTTLIHNGKEFSDFCLSLRCDNAGERFGHWFEACGDCKNTQVINAELRREWASKQPPIKAEVDRAEGQITADGVRSEISNPVTENDIPNCCGPDGILNSRLENRTGKCNTEMDDSVKQRLSSCTLASKQSIEVSTNLSDPRMVCVSRLNGNKNGGLVCRHHCPGKEGCIQACMVEGDAMNFQTNQLASGLPEGFNLTEVLGVARDEVVYGEKQECEMTVNKTILYPEWQCDDRVTFKNGGLQMANDPSRTLGYGQFCIEPLGDNLIRGTYRIATCWNKPEKERNEKNFVYYTVVLCISIICLVATISIYVIFKEALLRTEYNKFMLNFTSMLLLAFLTLVVQQNLDGKAMTHVTCSAVTLINQFAIIAAFTLMTLMSYSICRQIHGMKVMDPKTRYMRRLMMAYSIPAAITLLTLIVELAAPQCAAAKPNFGVR